jgi:hypothetical protein
MSRATPYLKLFTEMNIRHNIISDDKAISFLSYINQYYDDTQLLGFLLEVYNPTDTQYVNYFSDLLSEIELIGGDDFKLDFKDCVCDIVSIYNRVKWYGEYCKIRNHPVENFTYSNSALNKTMTIDKIDFILPKNTIELNSYSKELNNCLWGYGKFILENELIVLILKDHDETCYAIEVLSHGVIHILNTDVEESPKKHQGAIKIWMSKCNLKTVNFTNPIAIEYEA